MTWNVEYTDDFGRWWGTLSEGEQEDVAAAVTLLEAIGGDKTGDDDSYKRFVPLADRLYDEHLEMLAREVSRRE